MRARCPARRSFTEPNAQGVRFRARRAAPKRGQRPAVAGCAASASGLAGRRPLQGRLSPAMAPKAAPDGHADGSSCPPGKLVYRNRLRALRPRPRARQPPSLGVCIACAETAEVWWGTAGRGLSPCRDSDRLSLAAGLGKGGGLQAFAPCS